MDSLNPADMVAVLERTNFATTDDNFLLPIYEAISNAIYSIEEKWLDKSTTEGEIFLRIRSIPFSVTITDNGIGLDDANYENFKTPFTGSRLKRGGKGFGRFIAFKVFETVEYESKYSDGSVSGQRSFSFDLSSTHQFQDLKKGIVFPFLHGCSVHYSGVKPQFDRICATMNGLTIVERIIRYFLPFFLAGRIPDFIIEVDSAVFDIKSHFKEFFNPTVSVNEPLQIAGESYDFQIDIAKVRKEKLFDEHMLLLFADGRIIGGGRSITNKIGQKYFENADGDKELYVACVSSSFLDERANMARTESEVNEKDIDLIVDFVTRIILGLESEFVETHRARQKSEVQNAIARNPLLRTGLKGTSIQEYVNNKPMSWKTEAFVGDLALLRYRVQNNWEKHFAEGLTSPEKLNDLREDIMKQLTAENKDALASYIAHRKSVLELTKAILGFQENGKMSPEDMLHDIIHPRYKDSENTSFYKHNLWMIDDKLAFFDYCSSDRTIHGGKRQKGDKVGDLIFFEDCSIHKEESNDCIVIVEFKKPGRDDYRFGDAKHDPLQQVIETALQIREKRTIQTTSGRIIDVPDGTRISAYVVADIRPTLRKVCKAHDMDETWDAKGFYKYHKTSDVFVEINGYDKVLTDANKRNAAMFDVLLGDIVN